MPNEKVRIFALARELGLESKDLLALCRQNGIDIKNQLSTIESEMRDRIVKLVQSGGGTATATATLAPPKLLPDVSRPMRNLNVRPGRPLEKREPEPAPPAPVTPATPTVPEVAPATQTVPEVPEKPTVLPVAPAVPPAPAAKAAEAAPARPPEPTPAPRPAEPAAPAAKAPEPAAARPPEQPAARPPDTPPVAPPVTPPPAAPPQTVPPHGGTRVVRNLDTRSGDSGVRRRERTPGRPTMSFRPTPPPPLKVKPPEPKPQPPAGPKKIAEIPAEMQGPIDVTTIQRHLSQQAAKGSAGVVVPEEIAEEDDAEGKGKDKSGKKRPGGVAGRDARHKERNARQEQRKRVGETVVLKPGRVADLLTDDDTPRTRRLERIKKKLKAGPQPRKGKVPIELPITVRSLSEATGINKGNLLMKLMNQGAGANININSTLDPVLAEAIALEHGCELDVKHKRDAEEQLLAESHKPDKPEDVVTRAPIVTIMGHVDHGKTSLLDKIRHSNVTATEAGGITQVIRAWRVEHNGRPITFLDTPGHEAFTKMRARGANVTDIAVIVVAVDDGVMPQTEEAINHAKAAGVALVVALNKVDLPNANIRKTEQQLYAMGVLPDNMGGDVPFVQTSAVTGKGIEDLMEAILLVADYQLELRANPNKPAAGTCLEAYLNEEEGVLATLLIRDGTLHRGEVVVCGASYGRVRAMYDDLGRPIVEAGPTVPVRITGLDEVPNADDPFHVVPDLADAREIAEKRTVKQQEAAQVKRAPLSLESLTEKKITELKVILKAEARGSIEAIRKELEKLRHEEVAVRVLEAAIGGITENDVWLALTSPEDTLILGFNVVPDDRALALAEERGVKSLIRQYNIIYNLTDDVRSALEGKLKPREEIIHLGRAVVRETFKISRVGTIAGCHVTQGTIERSSKVRVIRSGVVIYPPPERTVGLESLKRFKEDVREVREGFECGLKVAGYDDIKVDDVIEAYRIEQVQRTLS